MPAAYFTGDSHGQGKEACCVTQEKLETPQGKGQAYAQDGGKAHEAETGKVQGPACGQWCSETRGQEKAATEDRGKKGTKKSAKKVVEAPVVEDTIIDVIDEPVPGVVVVTEYESIRTGTPISPGREPKRSESGSLAIFKTLRTHDWANSPHPSSDARYCRQLSG